MNILVIEPYYSGSHKAFIKGLKSNSSRMTHHITHILYHQLLIHPDMCGCDQTDCIQKTEDEPDVSGQIQHLMNLQDY